MNKKQVYCWVLLFLLLFNLIPMILNDDFIVRAAGSTYYISANSGDDVAGDGSIGNPYHTFKKAISVAGSGDTIYARGGVYNMTNETLGVIATHGIYLWKSNMLISSYNHENVIISCDGLTISPGYGALSIGIGGQNANNVTLDGINISNVGGPASSNYAFIVYNPTVEDANNDITIVNCSFYNISNYAIFLNHNNKNTQLKNYNINNCSFDKIQVSQSSGEGVGFTGVNNVIFEYNLMTNCTKTYIDCSTRSSNVTIRYNHFFNNGTMNTASNSACILIEGGQKTLPSLSFSNDHQIYKNYIHVVDGSGISVNGAEKSGGEVNRVSISNNHINITCDTTNRYGISLWNYASIQPVTDVTYEYNTVFIDGSVGNVPSPCLYFYNTPESEYSGCAVVNNIFVSNVTGNVAERVLYADIIDYPSSNIILANNLFNHTFKTTVAYWNGDIGNYFGDDYINSSPMFVSFYDFHLTNESPGINKANSSFPIYTDIEDYPRPITKGQDIGAYEFQDIWYGGWSYRKAITFNRSQVPSNQVNIPLVINLSSDADLASKARDNGYDILFTNDQGNKLWHEIEYFDGTTGRLVAWVNVTDIYGISESYNTTIYMYYGNSFCSNQENITGVWDSNYIAVWHMDGTRWQDIDDSTINNHDAISEGQVANYDEEGIVGQCVQFDGVYDYINIADSNDFTFSTGIQDDAFMIEAVYRKTDVNDNPIVGKYSPSGQEYFFGLEPDGRIRLLLYDDYPGISLYKYSSETLDDTRFHYIASTYDGSEAHAGIWHYTNGSKNQGTGSKGVNYNYMENTNTKVTIGWRSNQFFKGYIDELRFSDIVRSDDWIETTYNNIENATSGGFFTLYAENGRYVETPTNFIATTQSNGYINISFTKGVNATHTYIEYNTISSWDVGDGTLLYNNTGNYVLHSTVSCGIVYYYQGWGYNVTRDQYSVTNVSSFNLSCPGVPTSVDGDPVTASSVNISWLNATVGFDKTVVVMKTGGFPSNPSDGIEIYNDTGNFYVYNSHATNKFYKVFTYNNTVNRYSSGVSVLIGGLTIRVYDELTHSVLSGWGIIIRDPPGDNWFINTSCTNPLIIDTDDLPTGNNVYIHINKTGYSSKTYYMTISLNLYYTLNCYLAVNTTVENYILRVVDSNGNGVSDARIHIKRFINDSYGYENVTIVQTDGYGYVTVSLVPGISYLAVISKDGYKTAYKDLDPIPIVSGDERYITLLLEFDDETYPGGETEAEVISFTGYINRTSDVMYLYFDDSMSLTIDAQVYIYEYNYTTGTRSLFYSNASITASNFTLSISSIDNMSRYTVVLFYNHTKFGGQTRTLVFGPEHDTVTTQDRGDDLFDLNYGTNPFGWSNTFLWVLSVIIYFNGGQEEAGFFMVVAGIILLLINYYIGFNTVLTTIAGGSIPILHIVVGAGMLWRDHPKSRGAYQ